MPSLGGITKYLGLLSIGKGLIDKTVFQKLLTGIAAIVAVSVVAGLLAGAIILAVFAGLYYTMLGAGFTQLGALAVIGVIISLMLALIVCKIINLTKTISTYSSLLAQTSNPVSPITDIIGAFIDGLKESPAGNKADNNNKNKVLKHPRNRRF